MTPENCFKDPDEVKVFSFDWTKALNTGATVTAQIPWTVSPAGPTFASETIVGGLLTSAKMSGGTHAAAYYTVTNRVTTSDGETLEESGKLYVRHSSSVGV